MVHGVKRLYHALTTSPRAPWWQDILKGAVFGDFAPDLGLPGAVTQVWLSYLPIVGDVCAARDVVAGWRRRDRLDILLNVLVMVPVIGGTAKVADVLRNARRVHRALHIVRGPATSTTSMWTGLRRRAA